MPDSLAYLRLFQMLFSPSSLLPDLSLRTRAVCEVQGPSGMRSRFPAVLRWVTSSLVRGSSVRQGRHRTWEGGSQQRTEIDSDS